MVRAVLKSWTHPLDADPGLALIELNLGTDTARTDSCVEATPAEARSIALALLDLADTAGRGGRKEAAVPTRTASDIAKVARDDQGADDVGVPGWG